jgi:hypothetical protein
MRYPVQDYGMHSRVKEYDLKYVFRRRVAGKDHLYVVDNEHISSNFP